MNREQRWANILLDYSINRKLYYHIEEYNNIIYLMSLKDRIPFNILQRWEDPHTLDVYMIIDVFDVLIEITLYQDLILYLHYVSHNWLLSLKDLNNENN